MFCSPSFVPNHSHRRTIFCPSRTRFLTPRKDLKSPITDTCVKVKPASYCWEFILNVTLFLTLGGVIEGWKNPNTRAQDQATDTETSVCVDVRVLRYQLSWGGGRSGEAVCTLAQLRVSRRSVPTHDARGQCTAAGPHFQQGCFFDFKVLHMKIQIQTKRCEFKHIFVVQT